jgi:hypothetical protein
MSTRSCHVSGYGSSVFFVPLETCLFGSSLRGTWRIFFVNLASFSSESFGGGLFGFFIGVVPLTATLPRPRQTAATECPVRSRYITRRPKMDAAVSRKRLASSILRLLKRNVCSSR